MEEKFILPQRLKTISFALTLIGLVAIIISFFTHAGDDDAKRVWANLLLNAVFFQGVAMASAFFQAATYVAYGGWHTAIKRIPEAISMFLPFTSGLLLLVLAVPMLVYGHHPLYHWTDEHVVNVDPILLAKTAYLNIPFFFSRFAFFVGILLLLTILMRRNSLAEDINGGLQYYKNNLKWASLFLLFFAIYISVTSWDWLMSLDAHWYSTMFGWYSFASFWVTGIAVITLVVVYLKKNGYLEVVNNNHLHDLGKLMFAFSIFWTYLVFCQFMLIWYANIPEETMYFRQRYDHFMWLFYSIFILNFVTPFLVLMSRDAKRKVQILIIAACIIIFGHFMDFYLMVMPGTIGTDAGFGLVEIAVPIFYIGLFIYVVSVNLSKANLVPKHHPFLQESMHHST
ncbi:MAG: quinol:cytochrome C oxidoreductase [Chitinophagales bacterium]|nr:quinol:cytochrome C oxidoreductase [Chitinophagales bacterium]